MRSFDNVKCALEHHEFAPPKTRSMCSGKLGSGSGTFDDPRVTKNSRFLLRAEHNLSNPMWLHQIGVKSRHASKMIGEQLPWGSREAQPTHVQNRAYNVPDRPDSRKAHTRGINAGFIPTKHGLESLELE